MNDLRASLERVRDRFEPRPESFVRIAARRRRRRARQRIGTATLAVVLALASFVFLDRVFRGGTPHPASSPTPTAAATPAPAANGLIAFGCGYQICTMNPDGGGVTDLIEHYDKSLVVAAYSPTWSPDGTKIAFSGYNHEGSQSGGGANYDVYVMNADGSDLRNLTRSPEDVQKGASQGLPIAWSPDGTMLAFEGDDGKTDGLYVVKIDGTGLARIAAGGWPAWSPDGTKILFPMGVSHGADLYTVSPDGIGLVQLNEAPGWDEEPAWSPDGSRIAFVRSGDGSPTVHVMNADGSGDQIVFGKQGVYPYAPSWSPDGSQLLFEAESPPQHGNYDIYVVGADGSSPIDITPTEGRAENHPIWSPDGTLIAFEATTELTIDTADYQVYLIRPDGTHERPITTDRTGFSLAWQAVVPSS